ncbi:MAG: CehA/McbA family metallohydrolase [Anaerolineae bacterium]|nr:CehA/McbA family metallohydrolase [Anaerolineae bacterium]
MRRIATGKADLHVHTNASDGVSTVRDVLEAASIAGLDVVAVTDHNRVDSALRAVELAPQFGLGVIVGEEVSTHHGHLLALFLKERIAPGRGLAETIAAVHDQGGIAVLAHPYDPISFGALNPWRKRLTEEQVIALDYDAMEVFNACLPRPSANLRAQQLVTRTSAAKVAGSDSHSANTIGLGVTLFPGHTPEDLRQAILERTTVPVGQPWSLRQYAELFGRRELRYAGVAATYALGLCGAAVGVVALAARSGVSRFL